jgi:hypothetical protein
MPHNAKTTPWIKLQASSQTFKKLKKGEIKSGQVYQISCGFEFGTAPNCRREQA